MKAKGIGIVGLGVCLPPTVRTNDYWGPELVRGFSEFGKQDLGEAPKQLIADLMASENGRIAIEEMTKWKDDPFHGARERRVVGESVASSDLETEAGRAALEDAGVKPEEIGLLLLNSFLRDQAVPGNAGLVHARLGLPRETPAIEVDGICGSFPFQLQLAAPYLLHGTAKKALLVQSVTQSRICDYRNPLSTTFGDAATAEVIAPVASERGILSCVSSTDGDYYGAAVLAPEKNEPWYGGAGGRLLPSSFDPMRTKEGLFRVGDMAQASVERALQEAGLQKSQVDFFTAHQTIAAFSSICRRAAGLGTVRTTDTFQSVGSISACSIPYNLSIARQENLLKDDDIAVVFTTGAGFNWKRVVFRWGS